MDDAILTLPHPNFLSPILNNLTGIYSVNPAMGQPNGKWANSLNRRVIVKVCHSINRGSLKFI